MILPGQIERIHSTSFQLSDGSNCCETRVAVELRSFAPCRWPMMLPKSRRLARAMLISQRGFDAKSMMFFSRIRFGGTDRPFLMSMWRWPRICRSTVSTSALHLAAIARSISDLQKPRSFMT